MQVYEQHQSDNIDLIGEDTERFIYSHEPENKCEKLNINHSLLMLLWNSIVCT